MSESTGTRRASGLSRKGLKGGSVGLLGAVVIGVSCIAPAYTLTASLGPTIAEVGVQLPAIFLVGFIPMLLVALGYRELNNAMPDSGTSFTWATRAFGPWVGWMGGWGLVAATIIVLSNLAAVAVEFFYLMLAQVTGNASLAALAGNVPLNIATTLVFIALACWVSYRGMETTKKLQYILVGFQLLVLVWFAVAAFVHVGAGTAFDASAISAEWFNPFAVDSFSTFAAGVSLSIFIYWGWDVTLTMNEETKDPEKTPGRAAAATIFVIVVLYMLMALAVLSYAGIGTEGLGAGNPENQESIFAALARPVMGPFAILMSLAVLSSSAASLQSTFVSPARTMLAMGHYRALPASYGRISPRFRSPGLRHGGRGHRLRSVLYGHAGAVRECSLGHHHCLGHDDLFLLRRYGAGLRLVFPGRSVRRRPELLFQVPLAAAGRNYPAGDVLPDGEGLAGSGLRFRLIGGRHRPGLHPRLRCNPARRGADVRDVQAAPGLLPG